MHSSTILPLHGGHAPKWLFPRMVKLGAAISNVIIDEFGSDELLRRLCDKDWFQALSCAIGYDWHSSGTTTVTIGALKEGLSGNGDIFIAGGKGKAGMRTPQDIVRGTDALSIPSFANDYVEYSKLAAKTDSSLVYENIGIYHHSFIFTKNHKWGVVQQAMDPVSSNAIRFQWFSDNMDSSDITNEPHTSVHSELRRSTMDLTFKDNKWSKSASLELVKDPKTIKDVIEGTGVVSAQRTLDGNPHQQSANLSLYPQHHRITGNDISELGWKAIRSANELDPKNYKDLLLVRGMGRKTLRSLAFVSSLIYDKELAYRDPVAYSYNLGGKDGIPFPVDRKTYDNVIGEMEHIVDSANLEKEEKYRALRRLGKSINS